MNNHDDVKSSVQTAIKTSANGAFRQAKIWPNFISNFAPYWLLNDFFSNYYTKMNIEFYSFITLDWRTVCGSLLAAYFLNIIMISSTFDRFWFRFMTAHAITNHSWLIFDSLEIDNERYISCFNAWKNILQQIALKDRKRQESNKLNLYPLTMYRWHP